MQATFIIPGPLREFADGQSDVVISATATTVGQALSLLWEQYPALKDRIMTEQGKVRQHINIFVGEENIKYTGGLQTMINDVNEVYIIPAVSGGVY